MKQEAWLENLISDLKPTKRLLPSYVVTPLLLIIGIVVTFVLCSMLFGLRPDISAIAETEIYQFYVWGSLAVAVLAAFSISLLRRPDLAETMSSRAVMALVVFISIFGLSVLATWGAISGTMSKSGAVDLMAVGEGGLSCTGKVVLLALPNLAFAYWILRRGAATSRRLAGGMAAIFSVALSIAIIPLVCVSESAQHLAISHGMIPLIASVLLALVISKPALRW